MSNTTNVELRLTLVDRGVARGIDNVEQRVRQTEQRITGAVDQSNARQRSSHERLSRARETLGIRSEHAVRREMQQTEAAYQRLARSGTASQDMLTRAAERTRQRITQLTNEMGRLTAEQQRAARAAADFERVQSRIRTGVAVGAGVVAGAYSLAQPVMTAMSYDQRLAYLANTASSELDATGRRATVANIESTINDSVRKFGGTRSGALDTYSTLLSSGEFSSQEAKNLLGTMLKGQTASGASSDDLAAIATAAKRSGVATDDIPKALSKAIRSGQLGGFELKDLAKHLPALLSNANSLGVSGLSGFERVLVSAQGSVTNAGTKDEAANNLINIFSKINDGSTNKAFEKQGIDLRKGMAGKINQGKDSITAFTELIDEAIAKNPQSIATAKRIDELSAGTDKNNPNRRKNLEAIQKLIDSSVVGNFLSDRQALQGFRAEQYGNKSGLSNKVFTGLRADNAAQELNTSFDVIAGTSGYKFSQAQQEKDIAQKSAMDILTPAISKAADMFTDLSQKYPDLSAAVVGATQPVLAIGTAAGGVTAVLGGSGGGGLAGAAIAAGSAMANAVGLITAAVAGFEFGTHVVAPAVDKTVQHFTGNKNDTLGGVTYDGVQNVKNMVHVVIDTNDKNLSARVDKSKSTGVAATTTKGSTGNIIYGAP